MIQITHTVTRELPYAPTIRDVRVFTTDVGAPPDAIIEIHKQTTWVIVLFWSTEI